jgi:glycosyltransferase involved in cell wall biosynthesis
VSFAVARSTFFYTDSRLLGGAERAMFMLLESLDPAAWRPTLLLDAAPGVEPLLERAAALGVPVRQIAPMPLGLGGARRVPALVRMLRSERPAVFHAHMSSPLAAKYPLAAAVGAGVPAVVGTVQVVSRFAPGRSTLAQLRLLARGVDRYLAVSRDIAAQLERRFRWPAAKIEVVYNAVDPERAEVPAPPGLRAGLGAAEGSPLVLTAARLDAQKGHPVLFEAAAQVPEAIFALAGDGPERPSLEALAARLGIAGRIRFLGYRADVPELLAACDVFALPSLYEGSSLALLEAMAARRPVVSSAIGGTDELIEDGRSGLLVAPGDAAALAAALRRLLGDPGLCRTLAAGARERVERDFTRAEMARRVMAVYEELLDDGG